MIPPCRSSSSATSTRSLCRKSTRPPVRVIDVDYVGTVARAHEAAGFDRALVALPLDPRPTSIIVASHAASATPPARPHDRALGPASSRLPSRPGSLQPLDQFSGGARRRAHHHRRRRCRAAPGPATSSARQDGTLHPHGRVPRRDEARVDERAPVRPQRGASTRWPAPSPRCAACEDRTIPVYFGGASEAGVAGRRQARRRLRAVGRDSSPGPRADRQGYRASLPLMDAPRASASRCARSSPTPRRRLGRARRGDLPTRFSSGDGRPASSPDRLPPTPAPTACWPLSRRASGWTSDCGPRWLR